MRWIARKFVSIWVAFGLLFVTACAPASGPSNLGSPPNSPAPSASDALAAAGGPHFANDAPIDSAQSKALTDYLHGHQLPLVGARVLAGNGGPRQAILYGFVPTAFGKNDAADEARQFLNDPGAQIDNRIRLAPELATSQSASQATPDQPNNDVRAYEDQQRAEHQLQQYQSQGSGVITVIPMVGPFGSTGMAYRGFGTSPFGGSPFIGGGPFGGIGGIGPGWGGYPVYPSPMYPGPLISPGYTFPYRPIFP